MIGVSINMIKFSNYYIELLPLSPIFLIPWLGMILYLKLYLVLVCIYTYKFICILRNIIIIKTYTATFEITEQLFINNKMLRYFDNFLLTYQF